MPLEIFIPFLLPGFRIVWKSRIFWSDGGREIAASLSLNRGTSLKNVEFSNAERGVYRGSSGNLVLEDLFGFTSFTLYRGEPVTLYVYPRLNGGEFERETIITGGETATDDRERTRSDELLEVRKYYPGDDARRINWKMYAATGEMFLRIGEEIPPPSGEATVCLLADSPLVGSADFSSPMTDRLIDTLLALVRRFAEKGCRVHVLASGTSGPILYDPEKPDELLKVLAEASPQKPPPPIPLKEYLYAAAHPGAASLETLTGKREGETRVFLLSPQFLSGVKRLRSLIFRNGENLLSPARTRMENRISDAVNETLFELKKVGKGRIHVDLV